MRKHDIEIMKALEHLKRPHFTDILKQVNKTRKARYPNLTLRNTMSATTLNNTLKFLVKTKAVKRIEYGRKCVVYELLIGTPRVWYDSGFVESLTLALQILGFDLMKFPPFFGLCNALPNLNSENLEKLRVNLAKSVEMLERYIDSKK